MVWKDGNDKVEVESSEEGEFRLAVVQDVALNKVGEKTI